MTDTVSTNTICDNERQYTVQLLNTSDGTGESAVTKLDVSTLTVGGAGGDAATDFSILWIEWSIQGFTSVTLLADHNTTDVVVGRLALSGYKDYTDIGGFKANTGTGTGDLLLTTVGAASGATYDITICVRLEK